MSNPYINNIIDAIKASQPELASLNITPEMHFYDIPDLDSMSIVNFQMELSAVIGPKANAVQPIMDMTISEYAEILTSL
jgi:acyl carrier protein